MNLQWAAVRIVFELRRVPPQKGLVAPFSTRATVQGYSFFAAGFPPTILFLLPCGTPHLQLEDGGVGAGVGGGVGAGVGGGVGAGGLGGLIHPGTVWNKASKTKAISSLVFISPLLYAFCSLHACHTIYHTNHKRNTSIDKRITVP